jgi:hypothetical protein
MRRGDKYGKNYLETLREGSPNIYEKLLNLHA